MAKLPVWSFFYFLFSTFGIGKRGQCRAFRPTISRKKSYETMYDEPRREAPGKTS